LFAFFFFIDNYFAQVQVLANAVHLPEMVATAVSNGILKLSITSKQCLSGTCVM
jgi:hypothetical protein